ncbi:LlaJI family restriction endonuclease [Streptococcus suis]|uniref:LlaJI family restriction endonuclease n=1 Tax=Streptococcus suis TaxID=1307 RepID=UPI00209B9DFA|nr:LlaJI family restriction endonuclease [Streptococcus suis]MCO8183475.1 LlaJI family restriction endonuclease [Streptococcus suis]MCO8214724.1 LlaJI family restriction endonuclease [Streptococcus suis]HEM3496928.1 LlaJI family restriction endonuclease [Streptococcus suis]HEM3497459.1 LlaJI family restriction endonuclease [Streptococcus suis]HEM3510040.1 LlaJI family restriction endonuclease [Streptococcus suis]
MLTVPNKSLLDMCRVATNMEGDTFVGIKAEIIEGVQEVTVNFPLGFEIAKDAETARRDIIALVSVLQAHNDEESRLRTVDVNQALKTLNFPMEAYTFVIHDFINRGTYYKETEEYYIQTLGGRINWSRTIKRVQPVVQGNGFKFLKMESKKQSDTDITLLTEINKFCVYEAFLNMGWLYQLPIPEKARINYNRSQFESIIKKKMATTFNDMERRLFQSMIDILNYKDRQEEPDKFYFGTNNFQFIWENLIDYTYGIANKTSYFPRTKWDLVFETKTSKGYALEPDTIMVYNDNVFVLDAKYYKFGQTNLMKDLPPSTSINKQITYGEYVANQDSLKEIHGHNSKVYNAFLMPFSKSHEIFQTDGMYQYIGEALGEWKGQDKTYERVQGILVDVKTLVHNSARNRTQYIQELSDLISEKVDEKLANM